MVKTPDVFQFIRRIFPFPECVRPTPGYKSFIDDISVPPALPEDCAERFKIIIIIAKSSIILNSQQFAVFSDLPAIILVLSTADPKKGKVGSLD